MIVIKNNITGAREIKDYKRAQRKCEEKENILRETLLYLFYFIFTTSFTLSLAQKQLMAGITIYIFMTRAHT